MLPAQRALPCLHVVSEAPKEHPGGNFWRCGVRSKHDLENSVLYSFLCKSGRARTVTGQNGPSKAVLGMDQPISAC